MQQPWLWWRNFLHRIFWQSHANMANLNANIGLACPVQLLRVALHGSSACASRPHRNGSLSETICHSRLCGCSGAAGKKLLCSFMSGFTDAFQSSLATPCKIFLAENPSGDKVEVTGSGSGSELHIVPVFREAVLPRDVPTVAARGHQPAGTVHFWISGFGPQGHFRLSLIHI